MFDSGANLFSELKSIFENGAASSGGSRPTTLMFMLTSVEAQTGAG